MSNLQPAKPVLSDMIGAHIQYVHGRPYGYSNIIATGKITEINQGKNGILHFRVQPDAPHLLPKWKTEHDLIRYLPAQVNSGIEMTATAAA